MSDIKHSVSRSKRFIRALLTGYAALGSNIIYTLTSIPLALHYLTKEEFGLWALITQLTGYLMLLDLGMSGSITRFMCDHKDDMDGGEYGSVLLTGFGIFFLQGFAVLIIGGALVLIGGPMLGISPHLCPVFINLGLIQTGICGVNLMSRAFVSPLWTHQRLDINNLASVACQVASLLTLWLGFHAGLNVYSLSYAAMISFLLGVAITVHSCFRLHLYPTKGHWGGLNMKLFREMLAYGSGLLVLNLGSQLVSTSQVIVITRTLGLECASIWAVSTKLSTLVQQFVNRIFETSAAGFVEMLVRNETAQLRRRLRDLVMLASTLAGLGAVALAIFNQPFLAIWTSGKISWPGVNDSLLGGVVFLYCVSRFHVGFGSLSTDVHKIKYIILAEGALFIGLAFPLSVAFGLTGILMASLSANLLTSFCGSLSITAKHLGLARLAVMSWVAKPAVLVICLTLVYAAFPAWPGDHSSLSMTLALKSGVFLLLIVPMFLYVGLSDQLRSEILRHISSAVQTISVRFDR